MTVNMRPGLTSSHQRSLTLIESKVTLLHSLYFSERVSSHMDKSYSLVLTGYEIRWPLPQIQDNRVAVPLGVSQHHMSG